MIYGPKRPTLRFSRNKRRQRRAWAVTFRQHWQSTVRASGAASALRRRGAPRIRSPAGAVGAARTHPVFSGLRGAGHTRLRARRHQRQREIFRDGSCVGYRTKGNTWCVKMALHKGGQGGRYACAPGGPSAVSLLGRICHWSRDRGCEPAQLTERQATVRARMEEIGRDCSAYRAQKPRHGRLHGGVLLFGYSALIPHDADARRCRPIQRRSGVGRRVAL
jgi:hypothetical protein